MARCDTCGNEMDEHWRGACPQNSDGTPAYRKTLGDRAKSTGRNLLAPRPKKINKGYTA
ncbi:hypothetical protein GCM10023195_22500 [Actinoallomurus liliacearum]|uniref:Uncharacterized protein n=1 Tax=Actinoallomurus liliacearum TaxID=1080073 RepID=A0ABP8THF8_9ACTN